MSLKSALVKSTLAVTAMFTTNAALAQNAVLADDSKSRVFTDTLVADPHVEHLYHLLYKRSDTHSKSWIRFSVYDTDSNAIISLHKDDVAFAQYTNVGDDYEQGSYTDGERGIRVSMDHKTGSICETDGLSRDEVKDQIVSLLFLKPQEDAATVSATPVTGGPK